MAVSTIALYASPPSSVCSTPYPNSHPSYDFDLNGRSSSSPAQKPVVGGLSSLFSSSSTVKPGAAMTAWKDRPIGSSSSANYSSGGEGLGSLLHDRGEELSSSFCYSPYPSLGSSIKRDQSLGAALNKSKVRPCQSPISVFQGPVSCSSSSSSGVGLSRSLPMRFARERDGDVNLQGSIRGETNGFVQHTLGSCVNYDMLDVEVESSDLVEELTFNMEDNFMESNPEQYAKDLLLGAQVRHKIFYDDVVIKAFYEAEKAHRGQMRASGDPYLHHCVETAVLLAMIGANSTVVAAGLLHDTLDDSFMCYDNIFQTFGAGVADLVEGVSKLSQLSKLARESNTASKKVEADRLHTMFLAMADARAVLVKLADRLHNMMTLDALPLSKQQRFAKETLEIFAPLANRLGIFSWKEQLENICFRYLNPDQHRELSSQLLKSFDEAKVTCAVEKLEQALQDESISYHVLSGRHKSLYGIYRKMLKKKLKMDEIHDIHALRLIVENEEDCYKALRVVRRLWSEVPGKFKDYINHPKCNGYQSLHTVVSEGMGPLEVQIRTKEMHLQAEYGFAAHWRYKEGDCKHSSFVLRMVEWARWVLTWQCETMNRSSIGYADSMKPPCIFPSHSEDCPYSYKPYCGLDGPIFVIVIENDKMSVQEFSANSIVTDILERGGRGSSRWAPPYGFPVKEELRPTVNGAPVNDATCALKMGDVVDLTPTIPDKSLTGYREEIRRMYDLGLSVSSTASKSTVGWRS